MSEPLSYYSEPWFPHPNADPPLVKATNFTHSVRFDIFGAVTRDTLTLQEASSLVLTMKKVGLGI